MLLQPVVNAFAEGVYYMLSIGGNDVFIATSALDLPSATVIATFVPAAAAAVEKAITVSARLSLRFLKLKFAITLRQMEHHMKYYSFTSVYRNEELYGGLGEGADDVV